MNTHTRLLSHVSTRLLVTAFVLSSMIVTHSTFAMQQDNPPLAQAQAAIAQARKLLDIKPAPRRKKLDDEQIKMNAMLAGGFSAVLSGVYWVSPRVYQMVMDGSFEMLSSSATALAECFHSVAPHALYVLIPAAVGLGTYVTLKEMSTQNCFKRAVLEIAPIIKELEHDDFLNGFFDDNDLKGYILARFGSQGALKALEHYRNLHSKLVKTDEALEEIKDSDDTDLVPLCTQLQTAVKVLIKQLIKKITAVSIRLEDDVKEQLRQQREDDQRARFEAQREADRLREELARERDRAAAMHAGAIEYKRVVGAK